MPNLLFLLENDAVECRRFLRRNPNADSLKKMLEERLELIREIEGLLTSFVLE